MTYIVTKKCEGDKSCLDVCPVDCIHEIRDNRVVIDGDECIDCGACLPPCPYFAIKTEQDATASERKYNADELARRS